MLTLALSHTLQQSQSLSIELGLSQSLAQTVGLTRPPGSPGNPEEILARILANIVASITNARIQEAVSGLTSDPSFVKGLLLHKEELAVLREGRIEQFAADHLYTNSTRDGKFVHAVGSDGKPVLDPPQTTGILFRRALLEPENFGQEVELLAERLRQIASRVHSVAELKEMTAAKNIAAQVRPLFENFCAILELVFAKKTEDMMTVAQFLRDAVILEKLDLIMSERLLKRFLKRFRRVGPRAVARDFEESMLNTVAEYTLISMGVISPDIFALQRSDTDSEAYDGACTELSKVGIDLSQVLAHYQIQPAGRIFWHRYSTTKVKPSDRSEQIVRDFIIRTVRQDRQAVLAAVNHTELFAGFKAAKAKYGVDEEFDDEIIGQLTDQLGSDSFQLQYLALLRRWYPQLEKLL